MPAMRRGLSFADNLVLLLALAVVAIGAYGCYDSIAHPAANSRQLSADYRPTLTQPLPEPFAGVDEVRILVVGSDTRPHDVGRADSILIAFIRPRLKKVALISIPRDLRVPIPGHGVDKINHSYAYGGIELTRQTVEQLLGLEIPYYVHLTLDTFVKAIDMLGGVWIEVPDVEGKGRGMNYDDNWGNLHIHLKPGWRKLDGYQAMGFVRYRKDSDIERTRRQQQLARALIAQKLKAKNLPALLRTAAFILKQLDTNLTWRDAVDLIRIGRQLSSSDVLSVTLPVRDRWIGGIYYAELRESAFREVMQKVRDHLRGWTQPQAKVTVLNGCGISGAARRAAQLLDARDIVVDKTDNADSFTYQRTVIEYPPELEELAREIEKTLGVRAELRPLPSGGDEITVTLGRDFGQTLSASPSEG